MCSFFMAQLSAMFRLPYSHEVEVRIISACISFAVFVSSKGTFDCYVHLMSVIMEFLSFKYSHTACKYFTF